MRTLNLIQDLGEPQDVHLNRAWHQARQRSLQRTLQALFREKLLQREHLIFDGHYAWLPLWKAQSMLRIEGCTWVWRTTASFTVPSHTTVSETRSRKPC
ncbi:hypothetical protein RJO15_05880 [Herbaspirillum huttiense F1]|uniref:Uncharacterized protein n=1 Tax=Herbaspirillum huttiense subsp. lycopersici TaxID=3074428 RepID=A0ABU2EIX2_9BURK|nr:hypothetical protein [Herbaspirillum huttiense]MDR9847833.1 hypothetical protein [Herbaspirillum huttiense SE1]MDT0355293.1 hypothetical protein [Herbaspirillum huttiense F1]